MKVAVLLSRPGPAGSPFKKMAECSLIDLMVYYCSDTDPFGRKMTNSGALFLNGYCYKFLKWFNLGVIKELFINRPDIIVIYGWNTPTFWLTYLTAFFKKIHFVMVSENPLNQELLKNKWKQKIKKLILPSFFKRVNGFLYIGLENRKFYKHYGVPDKKLFFFPFAVDNDYLISVRESLMPKRDELRKALGIKVDDVAILFMGRLIEKKRPMDLLQAYRELLNRQPKTHLIFVGDGILGKELVQYVRLHNLKRVHLVGFKDQYELEKYYAMSDIFVLPSGIGETWGFVVNEAMCFGLPVVASDIVGSAKDLVKQGENGFIFSCGDIAELSRYLEHLIKNLDQRKLFGEKSMEIVKQYSYEKNTDGILGVLEYIKKR